ncbi:MAG: hypothetical protein P8Y63_16160 [Deltaproteobacteria bacterium]
MFVPNSSANGRRRFFKTEEGPHKGVQGGIGAPPRFQFYKCECIFPGNADVDGLLSPADRDLVVKIPAVAANDIPLQGFFRSARTHIGFESEAVFSTQAEQLSP